MKNAIHQLDDAHSARDGAGAAVAGAKPNWKTPRPKSRSRQYANGTQSSLAAAGPASAATKPIEKSPGTSKRSRQKSSEPHCPVATAGPAITNARPRGDAPGTPSSDGQSRFETQSTSAIASNGRDAGETQSIAAVAQIRELWRRRQSWHRAEKSLTLQSFAVCRRYVGGDKEAAAKLLAEVEAGTSSNDAVVISCIPLLTARNSLAAQRKPIEKELAKLAESLPVAAYVDGIRGFGFLSLAALVGECGDIGSYKSASAVWKRMGLAVINGERQRRVAGVDALEHGYSPERRSIAWNIGVSIMRAQKPEDALRAYYDAEKERQLARELTKGHAHNRACRHMTKRLLAELYGAWRHATELFAAVRQSMREAHSAAATASPAREGPKPKCVAPGSSKRSRPSPGETHRRPATASPAIVHAKPERPLPGISSTTLRGEQT